MTGMPSTSRMLVYGQLPVDDPERDRPGSRVDRQRPDASNWSGIPCTQQRAICPTPTSEIRTALHWALDPRWLWHMAAVACAIAGIAQTSASTSAVPTAIAVLDQWRPRQEADCTPA